MVNAPKAPVFLEVAKLPLSVRITGSRTVKRVAKRLKNSILTSNCAKLGTGKAEMLLRAGLNLRFLQEAEEKKEGRWVVEMTSYQRSGDVLNIG